MGAINIFGSLNDFLLAGIIYSIFSFIVISVYGFSVYDPEKYHQMLTYINIKKIKAVENKSDDFYKEMKISQLMLFYYRCVKDRNEFAKFDKIDKEVFQKHLG